MVVALLVVTACAGDEPAPAAREPGVVVVASFDFAESRLLAEMFAQALEDDGVVVRRELGLGQRELVLPALRAGLVDVVPEYAGSALDASDPGAEVDLSDARLVVDRLAEVVEPWGISVLDPSPASNQNVIAVPSRLAREHRLSAISDLRALAPRLVVGGPPECPDRPRCLLGLSERYGVAFESFVPLAGAELVHRALEDGVIDVGVLFSTDAALAGDDLVVLEDDARLQPPDNVVAVVRTEALADPRVGAALQEVSDHLTTTNLRFVNWRVADPGADAAEEARGWLLRRGLIAR